LRLGSSAIGKVDASRKTLPHPSGALAFVGGDLSFVLERKPNVVETFQQAMSLESVYDKG
jgi:hypothetical protein